MLDNSALEMFGVVLSLVVGVALGLDVTACTQMNKEKAMYASPTFDPPLSEGNGAFDVVMEVHWDNLDSLRTFGKNGIFASFPVKWHGDKSPGGYLGPQVVGANKKSQVLFSLWDHNKGNPGAADYRPALPRSPECRRNCQDCHGKETTGTQCAIHLPEVNSGQQFRLRIRQTATDVVETYNGKDWVGDEWEVTIMDINSGKTWLVGRQLLAGVQGVGIKSLSSFNEHIGCTPCGSFSLTEKRFGPWILKPNGTRLVGVSSKYSCDQCTCKDHYAQAATGKLPGWVFSSGPTVGNHQDWNNDLFKCDDGKHDCDTKPTPPTPPSLVV